MAGRPKKFSAQEFETAVERYFRSIARTEIVTERVSEMVDGVVQEHVVEVRNDEGEPMMRTRWLRPPSVTGLCLAIGIDRSTWQNYADTRKNPKHAAVCEMARMRIECYLEELLSTKEKSVQGVIFNLEHNYWNRDVREKEAEQPVSALDGMSMAQKMALIRDMAGGDRGDSDEEKADKGAD